MRAVEYSHNGGGQDVILFVIGAFIGAITTVFVLGLMAVIAEERENKALARQQRERGRRALQELEAHYMDYY